MNFPTLLRRRRGFLTCVATCLLISTSGIAAEWTEREVTFHNGDVKLAGTLLIPSTRILSDGVVLVNGSGPAPRDGMRPIAEHLASMGLVSLIFDKRGSGDSTGSWTSASLDDLASDVTIAGEFLRTQKEVSGHRIGVFGVSQAGWVIPHAIASHANTFNFAIIVTGGALAPAEVEYQDYAAALDREKVTNEAKSEALALVEQYLAYLKTGADRAELLERIHHAQTQPWFKALNLDQVMPDEASRPAWAWVAEYTPEKDIRAMRLPLLVMLGGLDRPSLSAKSLQKWHAAAIDNPDATLMEMTGAAHGMTLPGTHHHDHHPPQFVPGYLEIIAAWLQTHNLGQ